MLVSGCFREKYQTNKFHLFFSTSSAKSYLSGNESISHRKGKGYIIEGRVNTFYVCFVDFLLKKNGIVSVCFGGHCVLNVLYTCLFIYLFIHSCVFWLCMYKCLNCSSIYLCLCIDWYFYLLVHYYVCLHPCNFTWIPKVATFIKRKYPFSKTACSMFSTALCCFFLGCIYKESMSNMDPSMENSSWHYFPPLGWNKQ